MRKPTSFSLDRVALQALQQREIQQYIDFCLGDTGAMFGHSPKPIADALAAHAASGFTAMLAVGACGRRGRAAARRVLDDDVERSPHSRCGHKAALIMQIREKRAARFYRR
jgi:hypothetical protein